jgi:predicted nuclease with RNAse H fold
MFVGIDVAGERKGFHVAVTNGASIDHLFRSKDPTEVVAAVSGVQVIAIDAPRRATIVGSHTRSAERELHKAGYRVQWTRRYPMPPQEWMLNGQLLWDAVLEAFPAATVIETFPTAAWRNLAQSKLNVSLSDFADTDRATRGDFLDAIVAADVAHRYAEGMAIPFGLDDELNPIWT